MVKRQEQQHGLEKHRWAGGKGMWLRIAPPGKPSVLTEVLAESEWNLEQVVGGWQR